MVLKRRTQIFKKKRLRGISIPIAGKPPNLMNQNKGLGRISSGLGRRVLACNMCHMFAQGWSNTASPINGTGETHLALFLDPASDNAEHV